MALENASLQRDIRYVAEQKLTPNLFALPRPDAEKNPPILADAWLDVKKIYSRFSYA